MTASSRTNSGTGTAFAQLFLRLALGVGFISPVADRLGLWGPSGTPNVGWGDWAHFAAYARKLMFFLPVGQADSLGLVATVAEVVIGVLLIVGFRTRWMALGSGLLTLAFAASMTAALGIHAPLNYSVFAVSAGSFLLATVPEFRWSLDARAPRAG